MVSTILLVLAAIIAIPVLVVFAWKMLGFLFAIISDLGGLLFAVVVFAMVTGLFMYFGK